VTFAHLSTPELLRYAIPATELERVLIQRLEQYEGEPTLEQRLEQAEEEGCEIDNERIKAEEERDDLQARLDRIEKILDSGDQDEEMLDAIREELKA
jgi:small-conductance mechanosensitive channel